MRRLAFIPYLTPGASTGFYFIHTYHGILSSREHLFGTSSPECMDCWRELLPHGSLSSTKQLLKWPTDDQTVHRLTSRSSNYQQGILPRHTDWQQYRMEEHVTSLTLSRWSPTSFTPPLWAPGHMHTIDITQKIYKQPGDKGKSLSGA